MQSEAVRQRTGAVGSVRQQGFITARLLSRLSEGVDVSHGQARDLLDLLDGSDESNGGFRIRDQRHTKIHSSTTHLVSIRSIHGVEAVRDVDQQFDLLGADHVNCLRLFARAGLVQGLWLLLLLLCQNKQMCNIYISSVQGIIE
jgi:hypothetical protein